MPLDLERLKGYAPLCFIATGILLWRWTAPLAAVLPWIIAAMLFFAVLTMPLSRLRPRREHLVIYLVQMGLGAVLYSLLRLWDHDVGLSLLMCFLAPAATAAGAMTSLMGGDTGFATAYTLLTHGLICLVAPILLPLLEPQASVSFWALSAQVGLLVARMVLLPIALAQLVRYLLARRGRRQGGGLRLGGHRGGGPRAPRRLLRRGAGGLRPAVQPRPSPRAAPRGGCRSLPPSDGAEEYRPGALALHRLPPAAGCPWHRRLHRLAELLPQLLHEQDAPLASPLRSKGERRFSNTAAPLPE